MMAGSVLRVTAGVNVSLAVASAVSYATHPGLVLPTTIKCRRVGQLACTVSTLAALASSTMTTLASAMLMRYSKSFGVKRTVPGMGMAPSFITATTMLCHCGRRGRTSITPSP